MSSSSDFLKDYDLVEETIRKLYDSKLRLAILDALRNGPMRLADLRREVNANAPNTSSKAKELEELGLLERVEGDFKLTPYGKAVLERVCETVEFYAAYEKFKGFWNKHDLNCIPPHLLARLGELKDSELVLYDPTDTQSFDEKYYELMGKTKKWARGVLPVLDPKWIPILLEVANKGIVVEVVVTPPILKKSMSIIKEAAKKKIKFWNLRIYEIVKDPGVLLGITESFLAISLEGKGTKTYYQDCDIFSLNPRAIKWGIELFEYYKKQAKPIKLSDYL